MFQPPFLRSGQKLVDEWSKKLSRKLQTEFETFFANNTGVNGLLEGEIVAITAGTTRKNVVELNNVNPLTPVDWAGIATEDIAGGGGTGIVRYSGVAKVRFDFPLVPANGDIVRASGTTAGLATNLPVIHNDIRIGTILDASMYAPCNPFCMVLLRYCCVVLQ